MPATMTIMSTEKGLNPKTNKESLTMCVGMDLNIDNIFTSQLPAATIQRCSLTSGLEKIRHVMNKTSGAFLTV